MYRFLLSRQWVIVTLLFVLLIPVMIELGFWQLHRHEHRVEQNARIERSVKADPVPVRELTGPGGSVAEGDRWRRVTAEGTFDPEHEVVVRRRTNSDDKVGVHVLTPSGWATARSCSSTGAGSPPTDRRPRCRRSPPRPPARSP